MLHILLMVLKILGILLLILLGTILVLLLMLLLIPITYRFSGEKVDANFRGIVKVCWLFGLCTFVISYQEKKTILQFKIAGIDLLKILNKRKQKKNDLNNKNDLSDKKGKNTEYEKRMDKSETVADNNEKQEKKADLSEKTNSTDSEKNKTKSKNNDKTEKESLVSKIQKTVEKIKLTIQNIYDKINYWKTLVTDDRTRAAVRLIKDQLFKFIKHILPQKIIGHITYGFEDPCTTGQVLAVLSAIYPLYYKQLIITPDFSNKILDGKLQLKGRISIVYVLKTVLVLVLNKNIQYIIHIIRNKEES